MAKYISAQPCNKYFIWQVDTMLTSQELVGIPLTDVQVVFAALELFEDTEEKYQRLLDKWVPKGVQFWNYADEREYKGYIPSTKTYLLWRHWLANPWMENEQVLLTDSDVVFLKPHKFNTHNDDWWVTDTVSYIGWNYIAEKPRVVQELFLDVFDVTEKHAKENNFHSGGAQYDLQNVPTDYWRQSQLKSEELWKRYHEIPSAERKVENGYDLQIWTAEMWANLWCAWELNKRVRVQPKMKMAWPMDEQCDCGNLLIHNAGVTDGKGGLFFKGDYVNKDVPLDLEINPKTNSYIYYEHVKKAMKDD